MKRIPKSATVLAGIGWSQMLGRKTFGGVEELPRVLRSWCFDAFWRAWRIVDCDIIRAWQRTMNKQHLSQMVACYYDRILFGKGWKQRSVDHGKQSRWNSSEPEAETSMYASVTDGISIYVLTTDSSLCYSILFISLEDRLVNYLCTYKCYYNTYIL